LVTHAHGVLTARVGGKKPLTKKKGKQKGQKGSNGGTRGYTTAVGHETTNRKNRWEEGGPPKLCPEFGQGKPGRVQPCSAAGKTSTLRVQSPVSYERWCTMKNQRETCTPREEPTISSETTERLIRIRKRPSPLGGKNLRKSGRTRWVKTTKRGTPEEPKDNFGKKPN